ncbi:MAG TPA: hypothetical protein PLO08_02720 [Alicycliphilus sp.]|nr:hypothetical protein [Acidovorax temperans]HRM92526.1 hypothetical protein [Alicycliphilus sp.]
MDEGAALQHLGQGGFIQFHPALSEQLGFKAALFLGHALYWSRHLGKKEPQRGGWFFMTARQWEDATGLTAREQASVRELLQLHNLLVERVAGKPARLHYRVDLARLAQWSGLQAHADGAPAITWEAFAPWLKTSISFYRPLARISGSVASGLLLSYLLRQQRAAVRSGEATFEGYFRLSHEDARIALCLGTKTQRNARERLKALGFLQERAGGLCHVNLHALQDAIGHVEKLPQPARLHAVARPAAVAPSAEGLADAVRWLAEADRRPTTDPVLYEHRVQDQLQLDLFGRWLTDTPQGQQTTHVVTRMFGNSSASPVPVDSLHPVNQIHDMVSEIRCQPSALLSNHESDDHTTKGQAPAVLSNHGCRFVESSLPFCRTHIQQHNNQPTTTTACAREDASGFDKTASRRRISETSPSEARLAQQANRAAPLPAALVELDNLVMPKALGMEWHDGVRRTLATAPAAIHQALLDELEGQLGLQGKTIHNPPGYLHALIRRHACGTLDLAMADKVAAERTQRARHEQALLKARQEAEQPRPAGAQDAQKAEPSPAVIEERRKLLTLRLEIAGKGRAA